MRRQSRLPLLALVLLGTALAGGCASTGGPEPAGTAAIDIQPQHVTEHRGGDDLLTAGLGLDGLRAMTPPAFADAARSRDAIFLSAGSYLPCTANPNVRRTRGSDPAEHIFEGVTMQVPANQPEFKAAVDPAVDELNRIVDQAEALLRSLGEQTGDAAEGVRERVNETLAQARARLAATSSEAEKVVNTLADRADDYVRRNPWQAVALAALLGGVVTFLLSKSLRRG